MSGRRRHDRERLDRSHCGWMDPNQASTRQTRSELTACVACENKKPTKLSTPSTAMRLPPGPAVAATFQGSGRPVGTGVVAAETAPTSHPVCPAAASPAAVPSAAVSAKKASLAGTSRPSATARLRLAAATAAAGADPDAARRNATPSSAATTAWCRSTCSAICDLKAHTTLKPLQLWPSVVAPANKQPAATRSLGRVSRLPARSASAGTPPAGAATRFAATVALLAPQRTWQRQPAARKWKRHQTGQRRLREAARGRERVAADTRLRNNATHVCGSLRLRHGSVPQYPREELLVCNRVNGSRSCGDDAPEHDLVGCALAR